MVPGSDGYEWNIYDNPSICFNSTLLVGVSSDNVTIFLFQLAEQTWTSIISPNNYGNINGIVCTDNNLYVMYPTNNIGIYSFAVKTWAVVPINNNGNTSFFKSICCQYIGNSADIVLVSTYDTVHNSYLYISTDNGANWNPTVVSTGYDSWSSSAISADAKTVLLGEYYYNPQANNSTFNIPKNANLYLGVSS
jgi:hypothetical protein